MSDKHTPGPWNVKRRDSGWDITADGSEGYGKEIAVVFTRGRNVQEANARLIATAPKLLAELIACVQAMRAEGWTKAGLQSAVDVIAEAGGTV